MIYIIDANNLAGKLGLIYEKNFDKELIKIIRKYFKNKNHEINLVFDSLDPMGDKYREENITIIYTPKDNYYKSADDKIIELSKINKEKDLVVITDDIGIIEQVKKINLEFVTKIKLEKTTSFAEKINSFYTQGLSENKNNSTSNNRKSGLDKEDIEELNKELLQIWS